MTNYEIKTVMQADVTYLIYQARQLNAEGGDFVTSSQAGKGQRI